MVSKDVAIFLRPSHGLFSTLVKPNLHSVAHFLITENKEKSPCGMKMKVLGIKSSFTKSFMTAQNSIFSSLRNRTTPILQKAIYEVTQRLLDIGIQKSILNKG